MRNEQGLNIVLADNDDEVKRVLDILQVTEAFPLSQLPELCLRHPEATYYEVIAEEARIHQLLQYFHVRRGVISIKGKRTFAGFNVDWMGKILAASDLDRAIKAAQPEPPKIPKPVLVVSNDEDREDPYLALGYRR